MNDELSSSQRTNESLSGPSSAAAEATLTITPHNAEAKLAFSHVADWLLQQDDVHSQPQSDANLGVNAARKHAKKYMWISDKRSHDGDVFRLLRRYETGNLSSSSSVSVSSPPRELSPDTRPDSPETSHDSQKVWTGFYFIDLKTPPLNPTRGWAVGRVRIEKVLNDIVLCLSEDPILGVRQRHATFQVRPNNRISIQAYGARAPIHVDGAALTSIFYLNSPGAKMQAGNLLYHIEYGRFAREERHRRNLKQYLEQVLGSRDSVDPSLTPTPTYNSQFQIGQWTLTNAGTIGSGGVGRVSVGINQDGRLVVLKRMATSRTLRPRLHQIQTTLEEVTRLAKDVGEDRILRLVEVISDDVEGSNRHGDVWFVLEPVATSLTTIVERGGLKGDDRQLRVKQALVAIVGALDFLHSNSWIHGDIKPDNIGARDWNGNASSIVLLDIDDCIRIPTERGAIPATPGLRGTIGWLSPERECKGFDETTDIWSAGVVALWMLRDGRHPWMMRENPWRESASQEIQGRWEVMYWAAVAETQIQADRSLVDAVLAMVRFPYAKDERQAQGRPTAAQVLEFLDSNDKTRNKRVRRDE